MDNDIPKRLNYIVEAADRYQPLIDALKGVERPSESQSAELEALFKIYEEIARNGDDLEICKVIDRSSDQKLRPKIHFFLDSHSKLGKHLPWSLWFVRHFETYNSLDWTKLPAEWRFLAEPAEKYGYYVFDSDFYTLAWRMTPEEKKEIRSLHKRTLAIDRDRWLRWFEDYPPEKHRESELVGQMIDAIMQTGFYAD
jgi:hypothetical protein